MSNFLIKVANDSADDIRGIVDKVARLIRYNDVYTINVIYDHLSMEGFESADYIEGRMDEYDIPNIESKYPNMGKVWELIPYFDELNMLAFSYILFAAINWHDEAAKLQQYAFDRFCAVKA